MSLSIRHRIARAAGLTLATFCGATLGAGCGVAPVVRSVVETAREVRNLQNPKSATVDESYAQSLIQNPTTQNAKLSPGLVVAEPVAQNASAELVDFGTGCGRWLHLHAGGHGELRQTPLWGQIADARDVLPRTDLRLTNADAARFATLIGVTHLALGTISGDGARATLSYRLYQTQPKLRAVGSPFTASGTHQQIVQKLPQLASGMAKALGVASPRVAAPKIASADFTLLGGVPWKAKFGKPVAPNVASRLAALSSREPLAGVLFLRSGKPRANKPLLAATLSNLMKTAPQNTIAVADVARFYMADIVAHEKVVSGLRKRYPKNYLAATSEMQLQKEAGDWALAQSAAEDAVHAAPQSARAWLDLGTLLSNHAQSVRNSKYAAEMSASERSTVYALYPQQLSAVWRATQLTPQDSLVWSEVAEAATFNGNRGLADTSLWKAHALDKSNNDVYSWGLQMYQPKWGGDQKKLLQIARLAVQHGDPDDFPAFGLVDAIFFGGLKDQREELLAAAVKRSPKNVIVNYEYGALYHYDKADYKTAEKHYRIALAGDPNYARALGSLGDLHFFVKNDRPGAGRLYKQAVANAPGDTSLRDKLTRFTASTQSAR
jgi:tetratricopeptide (TPR) repeat protein